MDPPPMRENDPPSGATARTTQQSTIAATQSARPPVPTVTGSSSLIPVTNGSSAYTNASHGYNPHQQQPLTTRTLRLTPVDQATPSVYIRLLYIFPFPEEAGRPLAEQHLRTRLQDTINKWPFLAGKVVPLANHSGRGDVLEVTYQDPPPLIPLQGTSLFRMCTLSCKDDWHSDYAHCSLQRFRPDNLMPDHLSSLPQHPAPGLPCPALGVQANWLEGGLIVCFTFHHAVLDGRGMTKVLEYFAGKNVIKGPFSPRAADIALANPRSDVEKAEAYENKDRGNMVFWPPPRGTAGQSESTPKQYDFREDTRSMPLPNEGKQKYVSRILRFEKDKMATLKAKVGARVRLAAKNKGGKHAAWVSTMDCLCALVWISVMRCRYLRGRGNAQFGRKDGEHTLRLDEVSKFNIAVDARKKLVPLIPDDYIGNAFVVTTAEMELDELTGMKEARRKEKMREPKPADQTQGIPSILSAVAATAVSTAMATPPPTPKPLPPIDFDLIALAAARIREAISAVDDAYVRKRFNFAASLCQPGDADEASSMIANDSRSDLGTTSTHPSPTDCPRALHRALDLTRTGLDFSSWVDFPADLDFGIPGVSPSAGGAPEWVRKTWSANAGSMNILPRKGGTSAETEEDWEVLLVLAEEDMSGVLSQIVDSTLEFWGGST